MAWDFKNELGRKFVHFMSLFVLLVYFLAVDIFNPDIALVLLVFVLTIFLELEYIRLELGAKIPVVRTVWDKVRRDEEKDEIGSEIFFLVGSILVLAVFDTRVAVAAILMTTFGDLTAALIGKRFGEHYLSYPEDKAWEGIIAQFLVDMAIGSAVFILSVGPFFYTTAYWIIVPVMALTATVVETFAGKMDDNLLIPVFSGLNGQIILMIMMFL